jgi:hypothetical protein
VFKTITGTGTLEVNAILGTWAEGVGKCDLVRLTVSYMASASASKLQVGLRESGSSAPLSMICMKENGISYVSTSYNCGQMAVKELIPEANMSRQIRPVSSNLMMMTIVYDVGSSISAMLTFDLNVSTIRTHYLNA